MSMRARARFATAGVAALVIVSSGAGAAATSAATTHAGAGRARPPVASVTAPLLQIPDTTYPIPADALFVAPDGSDSNSGTQASPLQTVTHALAVVPSGGTIVLRAGTYRESFGKVTQPVTIQPYPHEQAWLSGSDVVTGWTQSGNGWVHPNWTVQFCHTCFASGAVDSTHPLAGWPDQVFFNGAPLTQVAALASLTPGTFYVDYTNDNLWVGSDPTTAGLTVEATTRVQAGQFAATAAGSIMRGIGIMRYGPSWNEGTPTGEIDDRGAGNMVFENDVFTQSANRGLFVVGAANVSVVKNEFLSNGYTGFYSRGANYFDFEGNVIDNNNDEKFFDGFSSAAGAGGAKISTGWHVLVKNNIATNNYGNGIWNDVSSYDVDYVDNYASRNDRNGFYIEITGTFVVASNLSTFNGQGGLKISGSTNGRVYNNTLADNATYQMSVHDDGRDNPNQSEIAMGITWDTANNTFVNNILAAPETGSIGPLFFTQNNESPVVVDAATMITGMDYDLFTRPSTASPSLLASWIHPAPQATSQYSTMNAFAADTGYEAHGSEVNDYTTSPIFAAPDQGDYTAKPGGPASQTGTPLPTDVAALVGAQPAVAVNRGALIYPGSTTAPPTPVNDAFSQSVALSGASGSIAGTTAGATVEAGEPNHAGVATTQSVWYSYQPSTPGVLTLDTCSNTNFDSVLAIYAGSAVNALTPVGSNNDACGAQSQVTVNVSTDSAVQIAVADATGGGAFTLQWTLTAAGTTGPPAVTGTFAGDGWASVAWAPPAFAGTSAISSYTVTAMPGGATAIVPAPGTRAVLTGLTDGTAYTFTVTASNAAGASAPSVGSPSTVPVGGTVAVTSKYTNSESTRLTKTAAYFGETTDQAQHDSVGVIAYIVGLLGPGVTPVSAPPPSSGRHAVTSNWPTAEQSVLVTVARRYALTPAEAQKFSTQLVGYLLALGGQ